MSIFHVDMFGIVMHYDGMVIKKFKSLAPPEKYCKCEFKDKLQAVAVIFICHAPRVVWWYIYEFKDIFEQEKCEKM